MKKTLSLLLVVLLLTFSACSKHNKPTANNENEPSKVKLTDELKSEIEDEFKIDSVVGISHAETEIVVRANLRSVIYQEEKNNHYTKCEIKSQRQEDDFTIVANGFVYGTDEYGQKIQLKFTHSITVIKDQESNKGYKISSDTSFEK